MPFYTKIGNFAAVTWCSFGSALIGLFLMLIGGILTGIAYTEITPPDYDDNYKRYIGSNVLRVVEKLSFKNVIAELVLKEHHDPFRLDLEGYSESRKHRGSAGHINYDSRIVEPEVEKLQNP
uniref:Uncharacterized protein n=1 Tax=Tetranychus urticae TaxID=32264 RepID=T1L6M8_TETUR